MVRPNFLVIGAQKAGTTSLHSYLAAHPQVFMARNKELHFFVEGLNGRNGWDCGWEKGWRWYEDQFAAAQNALAIGESSPSYSTYPLRGEVAARITEHLPGVRLIYLLRHPVERARSEYVHNVVLGQERRPIEQALLEDPRYLTKSSYALQIDQYLARLPSERLLLVLAEDLRQQRDMTMARIWTFLGVDSFAAGSAQDREFHRSADKVALSRAGHLARRLPGYASVARWSPDWARRSYRRLARSRWQPESAVISSHLRHQLEARLRADLDRLQILYPHAVESWGLVSPR